MTSPVHFFKTYYGRVDAINSILATCGMDRKSRRKTFRVKLFSNIPLYFEYGLASIDRLVFYNAYAIWRENMGAEGVNLQDSRYGFRSAIMAVTRSFAGRAMGKGIAKNPRICDISRKRSIVIYAIVFTTV